MPSLSDDIYRFIWDGRAMLNGIHPFSMTPEQIITSGQTFHRPGLPIIQKTQFASLF